MDFWRTVGVLLRRWPVALAVFGVTLGIAGAVYGTVPTEYESKGLVILTVPTSGATVTNDPTKPPGVVNPLLAFDGSLQITSQLLVQTLNDPKIVEQLTAQGATAKYEAGDGSLDGPFIMVVATGASPDESQRTVSLAFDRVREELSKRQTNLGAPDSTFINMESVVAPTPAEPKIGGKVRAAGAAFALGFAAALTSVYLLESHSRRKRGGDKAGKAGKSGRKAEVAEPEELLSGTAAPEPERKPQQGTRTTNGTGTNGSGVTGAAVNGAAVNGSANPNVRLTPAKPDGPVKPNGAPVNGAPVNGAQVNGTDGKGTANGVLPTGARPVQPPNGDPQATRRIAPVQRPPHRPS
ncbi:hypothetical protein UO65_5600 [Actinokineospora spheciospongiae]|uniref:Capsular polysaccharide biosynthesis protein n=1 Tax=Actinokineospora spheciospongiae TaxID=909613 RepID=W7IYM8_9PSEU|nr:hypothetical protein [Actinokineospora spheciospongiae]EWC59129.1 hypothetical protein UO65_5600 [Actinokineospora spheciospongiae]